MATRTEPGETYTASDLELFEQLAERAASAIENSQLYEETVAARMRAEQLYRFAQAVVVADRVESVFDAATLYQQSTFLYPSLQAEYVSADQRLRPRKGFGGSAVLRAGAKALGSDADFLQLHVRGSWFRGLGARSRLIVRGEVGSTYTDALVDIPPTLRFYAGGDRSIRGYEWREVGPRIDTGRGRYAVGAKNVVTASAEFEHYFLGDFGAAVFIDSGSAFDGTAPDWHTGVGIGARWRSPVGPVKIDIARGLDQPDSPFTVGLSIGADF